MDETLDDLAAEFLAEHESARVAEEKAAITQARAMDLAELERQCDRAAAEEVTRLGVVLDDLARAAVAEEELSEGIRRAWRRLSGTMASTFGGGIEAWEELFTVLSEGQAKGLLPWGVVAGGHHGGGDKALHALQRSRGLRHSAFDATERPGPNHGIHWLPYADRDQRYEASTPTEQAAMRARSQRVASSPPTVDDPEVAIAWFSLVAGVIPIAIDESVVVPFGSLTEQSKVRWDETASKPDAGARSLGEACRHNATHVLERTRWVNPLQPPPVFPRPSDAAVLRWWYRQATVAMATIMRVAPSEEHPEISVEWAERVDGVVELLDEAALFWLPPGQAASYLSSNPLDEQDRAELRMPYGRTLVVPAEGIEIPPSAFRREGPPEGGDASELRRVLAALDDAAADAATKRVRRPSDVSGERRTAYIDDVLPVRGAVLEAVLIEADRSGTRTDRIVWCAAVPSRSGESVLTRFAVPALASESAWLDVVDQLAAVTAWGDWIEAGESEEQGARPHDDNGRGPLAPPSGTLRVLDVSRHESDSDPSEPTGRKVAPHTRRGHWRRQHTGPGGEIIKRVRIAPTVVNASRGLLAPRVYRLPTPEDGTSTGPLPQP
jgi:hypothetical protein